MMDMVEVLYASVIEKTKGWRLVRITGQKVGAVSQRYVWFENSRLGQFMERVDTGLSYPIRVWDMLAGNRQLADLLKEVR